MSTTLIYPELENIAVLEQYPESNTKTLLAPWGRDSSLGTDEVNARGNMWGDAIGDSAGDGFSGLAHLDGGKVKRIEPERQPPNSTGHPARVLHTQLHVHGPLEPQAVERAVVRKLQNLRNCYSANSTSRADHEGRVDLDFEIDENGALLEPRASRVEQVDPEIVSCMLDQVRDLTFAASSGTTAVTYPLLLIPATEQIHEPLAQLPLAPEIPRTNEPVIPCLGTRRQASINGNCSR